MRLTPGRGVAFCRRFGFSSDQSLEERAIVHERLTLGLGADLALYDAGGNLIEGPNSGESSATPQNPTKLPPGDFLYYDIDTANPGSVTLDGNALTIRASGPPLWERAGPSSPGNSC